MNYVTKKRILLIDDDPLFGNMLCRKAAVRGIELNYYSSLIEAMYDDYLDGYDAAIIDCVMPGVDGFEISQYISTFLRDVPVVLVSQSQYAFDRYKDGASGASAFVSKQQGTDAVLKTTLRLAAA